MNVFVIVLLLAADLLSGCLAWMLYAAHDYYGAAFFLILLFLSVIADRHIERLHDERVDAPEPILPTPRLSDARPRLDAAVRAGTSFSFVLGVRDRVGGLVPPAMLDDERR
jgi:hypothetical protein